MKELLDRRQFLLKGLSILGIKTEEKDAEQDRRITQNEENIGLVANIVNHNAYVLDGFRDLTEIRLEMLEQRLFSGIMPDDGGLKASHEKRIEDTRRI